MEKLTGYRGVRVRVGTAMLAAWVLAGAVATAACGDKEQDSEAAAITLTFDTFGTFNYQKLLRTYEKSHPGIRIRERNTEYVKHHDGLAAGLDKGAGLGDLTIIDESYIAAMRSRAKDFYNLLDFGAGASKKEWLAWKWDQSASPDGKYQIALGTDIGGMALCYRTDLFAKAGLPTKRDEVSAMWQSWDEYVAAGKQFQAGSPGVNWLDSPVNFFSVAVSQQDTGYYDDADQFVMAGNEGIKRAWNIAVDMIANGLSARLNPFTTQWSAAIQSGKFATLACPAWMLGYLRQNAPETKGLWDIAAVPGKGGNWGGSFLAVPKQSRNGRAAYELAAWLTAPEQQLRLFKENGNLPSTPSLYADPSLREYKEPFVGDAPVGQIYGTSANELKAQHQGPRTGEVRLAVSGVLVEVDNGNVPLGAGWSTAVERGTTAANK